MTECFVCEDAEAVVEQAGKQVCRDCAPMFGGYDGPMNPEDAREVFAEKLRGAELDDTRFIDVQNGEKASHDHTLLGAGSDGLTGNYGVYAGPGADDDADRVLVDVDVDDYDAEADLPDALTGLPVTFSVESPHTDADGEGGHYYFSAPAETLGVLEEETGTLNASLDWGELRVYNQYCVGPGSQLNGCDKDWCDECAEPEGGYYRIAEDRNIAWLDTEDVLALVDSNDGDTNDDEDTSKKSDDVATSSSSSSLTTQEYQDRLEKAIINSDDERNSDLKALWAGDYAAAGCGDDRSRAESKLANLLGWWLEADKDAVRDAMNGVRLPDSVPEPELRKWPQKGSGYCESVLKVVDNIDDHYGTENWDTVLWRYENGDYKDARLLAAELLQEETEWFAHEDSGKLFRYDASTGTWQDDGENRLHELVQENLGKHASENEQNHIEYHLAANKKYEDDIGADLQEPLVACENGTLNLETGELLDHSPDHMLLEAIPVEYDPDAECEAFDQFLNTALGGKDVFIETIYDTIACSIAPGYPVANFVILHGDGQNGKTTLLDVLRKFVGDAVSSQSLADLTGREAASSKAQLYGKRANVIGDMSSGVIRRTDILKKLSDGNAVTAREKYGNQFEFSNKAQIIGAANNPPEIADDTKGMYRRLVPIEMSVNIVEETDADLSKDEAVRMLTTDEELSGILNKAVEAYQRVRSQNALTYQTENKPRQVRRHYDRQSNPITGFVEVCCGHSGETPKDVMHNAYLSWAEDMGAKKLDKGQLTKRLKKLDDWNVQAGRATLGGERKRVYKNIRLNEEGKRHGGVGQEYSDASISQ